MLSFFGGQKKPSGAKVRDKLPSTHAFVNFTVRGNGPQGRLCFEGASLKTFRTTKIPGMIARTRGRLHLREPDRKVHVHRAARLDGRRSGDRQPAERHNDDLELGRRRPARRAAHRHLRVNAEWRFKPVGKISTNWSKVTISDLSRTSGNMTAEREFKPQDILEIRMTLEGTQALTIDAAPVRSEKTGSKYRVSLVFKHLHEGSSHVITRFINKRMTELRARGLS